MKPILLNIVLIALVIGVIAAFILGLQTTTPSPQATKPVPRNLEQLKSDKESDPIQQDQDNRPTATETRKPKERPWVEPNVVDKGPFETWPTEDKIKEIKRLLDAAQNAMDREDYASALGFLSAMDNTKEQAGLDAAFDECTKGMFDKKSHLEKICIYKVEQVQQKVKRGELHYPPHDDPKKDD